jgi:hypothetical protein
MAWAKQKRRVPDYGRPKRRVIGFASYVNSRKQAKKTNNNNNNDNDIA